MSRNQFVYSRGKKLNILTGEIAVGSGGTPTLPNSLCDFRSVTRSGTGAYTVNLKNKYASLEGISATLESATSNDGYMTKLVGEWVNGLAGLNVVDGVADGYVNLKVVGDDSAAGDPIDHSIWLTLLVDSVS